MRCTAGCVDNIYRHGRKYRPDELVQAGDRLADADGALRRVPAREIRRALPAASPAELDGSRSRSHMCIRELFEPLFTNNLCFQKNPLLSKPLGRPAFTTYYGPKTKCMLLAKVISLCLPRASASSRIVPAAVAVHLVDSPQLILRTR